MRRKWVVTLLSVVSAVALLVACAGPSAAPPTTAPAAQPTVAPKAEAPAAGGSSGEVKIGFIGSFSGAYAGLGLALTRGVQMAVDEAGGTVNGKKIVVIQRDDKLNTQEAAKQAQELIQNDGVKLLMGSVSAAIVVAINEIAKRAGVVYVATAQTDQLNKTPDFSPLSFHVALTPHMESTAVGPWLVNNLGKKWYFLMPDYAFGKEHYAGLSKVLKENGGTEVGITWTPLGTKDFNPHIPKIREAKPDVLIAGIVSADLINFLKQAKSYGLDKEMKIYSPVVDLEAETELGFENLAGTYSGANYYWELGDKVPAAKKFADAFLAKHNVPPSGYAVYAYTAARLLIDAVAKAGSDDPEKVAKVLEGYKFDYTRGAELMRACDHQLIQPVFVLKGRTAQEAAAAGKDKFGFREIVATVEASESSERSCQELGLGDRQ